MNFAFHKVPSRRVCVLIALALGAALTTLQVAAGVVKIELPPETVAFKSAPGAELANGRCLTCHSVEYVLMQPPFPQAFWAGSVKKMREKLGAEIPDEQVEPLVKYLTENYGVKTNAPASVVSTPEIKPAVAPPHELDAEALATKYGCLSCHGVNVKIIGPAYKDVVAKYRNEPGATEKIIAQIRNGGSGKWGPVIMPPFPTINDTEARMLASWILAQTSAR